MGANEWVQQACRIQKLIYKSQLHFYTLIEQSKNDINKIIPFMIALKRKYIGRNLTKCAKQLQKVKELNKWKCHMFMNQET